MTTTKRMPYLDRITATQALDLLERLLMKHGTLSDPECRTVRCECSVCSDIYALFDEKDEYEEAK